MSKLLFATLFTLLFWQCKDDTYVALYYNATQCADPWKVEGSTNDDLLEAVEVYLNANVSSDYNTLRVTHSDDLISTCLACTCTRGKVIHLNVNEVNLSDFLALGFQKE